MQVRDVTHFALKNHFQNEHKIKTVAEYEEIHGPMVTQKRDHKCFICGSVVKCTEFAMTKHLKSHEMSLDKYTRKFMTEQVRGDQNPEATMDDDEALEDQEDVENVQPKTENRESRNMSHQIRVIKCKMCSETVAEAWFAGHLSKAHDSDQGRHSAES